MRKHEAFTTTCVPERFSISIFVKTVYILKNGFFFNFYPFHHPRPDSCYLNPFAIPASVSAFPPIGTPRLVPLATSIDRRQTWRLHREPPSAVTGEQRKNTAYAKEEEDAKALHGLPCKDWC